jgi:Glycosyl hydrolases family 2, sugar binding domain/Glycosyl hydrolases family 2, TIM barrel domain/Glycosyl hydrolases family 2
MRAVQDLDGTWQARLDPDDVGLAQGWAHRDVGFDRALTVPLPWQAADPELRSYAGAAWYRRTFRVPDAWRGHAVAVRFGAVDYEARVWLNGRGLGGHAGGYTPFELDLTPALDWSGDNHLVLRAFDPADLAEIPHGKQGDGWYTPVSGPWQSVGLRARPHRRVGRLRCLPDATTGTFRVHATCVLGGSATYRLDVEALDPATHQPVAAAAATVASTTPSAMVELRIPSPRLWSPDTPDLYTLRATLADGSGATLDVLEERAGLRTFEARDGRLLLNGEPFYLRGALDQAFWPDTLYTPPSDAAIEREIRLAKSLGLNLLRKHIKPEDPRYLDACDRLGLLVWAEPANPTLFTPAARAALRRDLLEMIERDMNRPSVVIWSLYNEDWGLPGLWSQPDVQAWLRELYGEVRRLDPTRPICDNSGWAHVRTDLNDYHEYFSLPDRAASFRARLDFIESESSDNYAQGHAPRGGEPLLVSEWGTWALTEPRRDWAPPQNSTDPMKTMAGFEARFRQLGLDAIFGTPAALVEHIQRRAFRSLTGQIEEMRRRPAIQGWVVTEFSDIEWEANGWLDYWRQPKTFTADLADLTAELAVVAIPEQPSVWAGEPMVVPVWLSNWSHRSVAGTLRWRVEGTPLAGELPASVGAFQTLQSPWAIRFRAPDEPPANRRLLLELLDDGRVLARAEAEVTWAPRSAGLVQGIGLNAPSLGRLPRQRLERQGYLVPRAVVPELGLAVTTALTDELLAFVRDGGRALWLAEAPSPAAGRLGLAFRGLSPGESWQMAGGSAWARADRLAPAPILPALGWEVADVFPVQAIDAASRQAGDEQLAGWFEGWLANGGVFILRRPVGRGQLLVTTFRLAAAYGLDPVATLLLNRLVEIVREA